LPDVDGSTSGEMLTTDGSGNVTWQTPAATTLEDAYNASVSPQITTTTANPTMTIKDSGGFQVGPVLDLLDANNDRLFAVDAVFGVNIKDQYTLPNVDGAANQVIQTDGAGTLSWVSLPKRSFSEVAVLNNSFATNIVVVDVWVPVAGSAINGPRSADFTPLGSTITYTGQTKTFKAAVNVSWECENKQDLCGLGILKNGNIIASSEQNANVDDNNTYPRNCTSSCIVTLETGDSITPAVRNRADTDNIIISYMNFSIVEV
jgi:hypothetical protein